MDYELLDVIIDQGTTYTTPGRVGYKIEEVGVDTAKGTSDTTLKIENVTTGPVAREVANLYQTGSYNNGLLDLQEQFYYVPPDTDFEIDESSANQERLKGKAVELGAGEKSPGALLDRYEAQDRIYRRYWWDSSNTAGTGTNWSDGIEYTVLTLAPETIEEYTLDDYLMMNVANVSGGYSTGDVGITMYYDNAKIPFDRADNLSQGIDVDSAPMPPTDTTNKRAFTLEEIQQVVEGDHDLEFRAINNSGGALTPTSGNAVTVYVAVVGVYERERA